MPKKYKSYLTADINRKGVLDLDTVKGCTRGVENHPDGCWGLCYAKKTADFRGIDFSQSITRRLTNINQLKQIAKLVMGNNVDFIRIGTMGDPCHNWDYTIKIAVFVAKCQKPVIIITKHWISLSDEQMKILGENKTIINTSISALDTAEQRKHRLRQYQRYKKYGKSILRIVSCDFNKDNKEGKRLAEIQDKLFKNTKIIDNPLRIFKTHHFITNKLLRVKKIQDLNSQVYMSKFNDKTYIGHCQNCPEKCGINL